MRVTVLDGSSRISFTTADSDTYTLTLVVDSTNGAIISSKVTHTLTGAPVSQDVPASGSANLTPTSSFSGSGGAGKKPIPPALPSISIPTTPEAKTSQAQTPMTPLEALADVTAENAPSPSVPREPQGCAVEDCPCNLFENHVPQLPTLCGCGHGAMYHTKEAPMIPPSLKGSNVGVSLRPLTPKNNNNNTNGSAFPLYPPNIDNQQQHRVSTPSPRPGGQQGHYQQQQHQQHLNYGPDSSCEEIAEIARREEALGDWYAA
eukprot:PhF_6_TR37198/c0_g1_i1/m.54813